MCFSDCNEIAQSHQLIIRDFIGTINIWDNKAFPSVSWPYRHMQHLMHVKHVHVH